MESGGESGSNAEASGGALQRVFYCHECQRRTFPNAEHIESFTCMSCGSGFVEDVTIREDSPSSQSDDQSWGGLEAAFADTVEGLAEGLGDWDDDDAASAASGASNTSGGRPRHRPHRRTRVHMGGQTGPISDQFIQSLIANLIGGATMAGGRGTPFADLPPGSIHIATAGNGRGFPGLFQVAGGGGGGGSGGAGVPFSMPLYGNPGDYAWGRGGLDAIVTQLLNQMDGTGPPPMSTEEIAKVPTIKVTQSHIDQKLQCAVCWDDFKLGEEVRQLKCEHIFHEPCIVPWLELHNTCPVCRQEQEVNPEKSAQPENVAGSTSQSSEESSSGVSSGPSPQASSLPGTTTSGDQRGQRGQQNPDQLMEALGRSISVFTNSFFGIPPNQTAPSTASSSTTRSTSNATSSSSSSSSAGPSTSTSTSTSSSSGSSQQQPDLPGGEGGGGGGSSFQDMDLE